MAHPPLDEPVPRTADSDCLCLGPRPVTQLALRAKLRNRAKIPEPNRLFSAVAFTTNDLTQVPHRQKILPLTKVNAVPFDAVDHQPTRLRNGPRRIRTARLAQEAESCGLIKALDRISERPPSWRSFCFQALEKFL